MADLKNKKVLVIAIVVLALLLGIFAGSKLLGPSHKYNKAISLMDKGSFEEAIAVFELLGDYKDSTAMIEECQLGIIECKYNEALAQLDGENFEEAMELFSLISDYKDSQAKIEECRAGLAAIEYEKAIAFMAEGNYADAAAILKTISYEDSREKYEECRATDPYAFTNIGDIISFGRYEQDGNHDNGPEELMWRVIDKQDGKVFVISDKAVEMLPYFGIYWKRSHIGGYLNSSFINNFTAEEKAMIVETKVLADSHPDKPDTDQGSDTEHGLYLLSVKELNEYFPNPEDQVCYASEYLKGELSGTSHLTDLQSDGSCSWWLRTAYENYSSGAIIATVDSSGGVAWATHNCRLALRPVCWIQLEG